MARDRRPSPQAAAVLRALAAQGAQWSHGYELCTRLQLKAGTVYPILIRLADQGHVEASWEAAPPRGRPARHLYRLTESGLERARQAPATQRQDALRSLRPAVEGPLA